MLTQLDRLKEQVEGERLLHRAREDYRELNEAELKGELSKSEEKLLWCDDTTFSERLSFLIHGDIFLLVNQVRVRRGE
jgi:hypothetical protein